MGDVFLMNKTVRRFVVYISIISVVALLFALSMLAPLVTTDADFSIYNTGWNGCSSLAVKTYRTGSFVPNLELAGGEEIEVVQRGLTSYDVDPSTTSLVFIGPDKTMGEDDADFVHSFLENGGKVLIADDFGTGNTLLQLLNTSSSFRNTPLMDLSFEKSPNFPVIYDLAPDPLTDGVDMLMLNHPTTLSLDPEATALVNSSAASWIEGGTPRKHPILSIERYGDGELILLSDPSVLINSMLDKRDNSIFVDNLLGYLSHERERIIFDESQREMNLVYSMVYNYSPPSRNTIFLLLLVGITGTTIVFAPVDFKKLLLLLKDKEKEDLVEKVLKDNPDWDERKLKMIYERFSND